MLFGKNLWDGKFYKVMKETMMNHSAKGILFSIMTIIFLVTACAPAPAATQDPALVQQLVQQLQEQSVALTSIAQNAQATQQQALIAPSNTPEPVIDIPIDQPTATPEPVIEIPIDQPAVTSAPVIDIPGNLPDTDPNIAFVDKNGQKFYNCIATTVIDGSAPTVESIIRTPYLELSNGDFVTIKERVNLRTGPGLIYRRIKILTPDANAKYKIIGGPAYSNLTNNDDNSSKSEKEPASYYYVKFLKYKWWQIEFSDAGETKTGWLAEATACGQKHFIEPVQ
jgi:hypothetical protein